MMSGRTVTRDGLVGDREKQRRARLAGDCRRWGIKNVDVASECVPPVDPSMVSHWFSTRFGSDVVEPAIHRLLKKAKDAAA